MTTELDIKRQVREFYDSVGWQPVGEGLYQNARYEDLRPVSRQYLHHCHLRVAGHLPPGGNYLLDAGSGPIQYPEYLEYSRGYHRRVCLDISHQALREARARIADHGLFVVGDIARPPFSSGVFDGVVSLHTIHHLPPQDHARAVRRLQAGLRPGGRGLVVYSWGDRSILMRLTKPAVWLALTLIRLYRRRLAPEKAPPAAVHYDPQGSGLPQGTYTYRHDYRWFRRELRDLPGFEIRVWRSLSTGALRALIHRRLMGESVLRLLYRLEERMPHLLGRWGQYPMILFEKPTAAAGDDGSAH